MSYKYPSNKEINFSVKIITIIIGSARCLLFRMAVLLSILIWWREKKRIRQIGGRRVKMSKWGKLEMMMKKGESRLGPVIKLGQVKIKTVDYMMQVKGNTGVNTNKLFKSTFNDYLLILFYCYAIFYKYHFLDEKFNALLILS